jgi:polyisoprenoid-binding protein YceI
MPGRPAEKSNARNFRSDLAHLPSAIIENEFATAKMTVFGRRSILSVAGNHGRACQRSLTLDQCPIAQSRRKYVKHFDNKARAEKQSVSMGTKEPPVVKMNKEFSRGIRWVGCALFLLVSAVLPSLSSAQGVPVFQIVQLQSKIKFDVKASVPIEGTFDQWAASLTFTSPDVTTAAFDVEIQAASVDTGSGLKNSKLKSADFFDVANNPLITFKSTKVVQTSPDTFELDGNFTIRGVTKAEKLKLTVSGRGTGTGLINGTMAFDRKDYGMNSNIPFIKIANRVEVNVSLTGTRVAGPPVVFQQ